MQGFSNRCGSVASFAWCSRGWATDSPVRLVLKQFCKRQWSYLSLILREHSPRASEGELMRLKTIAEIVAADLALIGRGFFAKYREQNSRKFVGLQSEKNSGS